MMRAGLVIAAFALANCCAGAEPAPAKNAPAASPLLDKGAFDEIRKPLERIFRFSFDGDNLKLDRTKPVKAKDDLKAEDSITRIFLVDIEKVAGTGGSGSTESDRERIDDFSGDKLSGRLHVRGDFVHLTLDESQAPQRSLEFRTDERLGFRIQVTHPDGDTVMLQQHPKGRFTAIVLIGDQVFAGQGDSFVAFYRQHRRLVETHCLPILEQFGIQLAPSPRSPDVRKTVLALLSRAPEDVARGRQLVADLESGDFAVRQKAGLLLSERFANYQDLIQLRLMEKPPLEVKGRLEKIVAAHPEEARQGQGLVRLQLYRDLKFLISLLDHVAQEQASPIVRELERATGQKLGADAAAWQDWATKNLN